MTRSRLFAKHLLYHEYVESNLRSPDSILALDQDGEISGATVFMPREK